MVTEQSSVSMIGGQVVKDEKYYPAVVSLFSVDKIGCTGTKVAPNKILTAAHCLLDQKTARYKLNPGDMLWVTSGNTDEFKTPKNQRRLTVSKVRIPDNYRRNPILSSENDVGVLVLKEQIDWIPKAEVSFNHVGADIEVIKVGFGCQSNDPLDFSTTLKFAYAKSLNLPNSPYIVTNGAASGNGLCPGDSGGPLFLKSGGGNTIFGVASFRLTSSSRDAHTRMDLNEAWIRANIK